MSRRDRFLAALLRVIAVARWLVPASRRREWHRQWHADVAHAWTRFPPRGAYDRGRLARRVFGALRHAFWLRTHLRTLDMLTHDLRYGWRLILRRPVFSSVAILTLGVAIGANVTIYSWIEALLLRPLPGIADSGRLVMLSATTKTRGDLSLSWPNFTDLRAKRPAGVDDLIAYNMVAVNVRIGSEPLRAWALLTSGNYFDALRVQPMLGRGFTDEEGRVPDAYPVVVLSYAFWQRHYAGDRGGIGRTITLNGRGFTIIGVAPEGFRGNVAGVGLDLFIPMMMQKAVKPGDRLPERGNSWLTAMVRLKEGASIVQAQAEFDGLARGLEAAYPDNKGRGLRLDPLWRAPGASKLMMPVLSTLMAMVGVVLLIACANVASLLLANAAGRQRETAVRLALGASRRRLAGQLLTESAMLACGGGVAGIAIAYYTRALLALFVPPTGLPLVFTAPLSMPVFAFAAAVTLGTTLVSGLVPAWQGSAFDVVPALKESAGPVAVTPRRTRLRHALVVAQVALSLMLLVSAGLFLRTLRNAQNLDIGFAARDGLLAAIDLLPAGYDEARGCALLRELLERTREIPGVEAATVAQRVPLDLGGGSDFGVQVDGYSPAPNEEMTVYYNRVGSDYLRTLLIPLIAGRDFNDLDTPASPRVAIVNETMARRYWHGRSAVGGRVRVGSESIEVVGVAADGKYGNLTESPRAFMYLPVQQMYRGDTVLHVRTAGDPAALVGAIRAAVRRVDANLPVFEIRTIAEHLELSLFVQRMAATLLGGLGVLALLLAMTGLYAVVAAAVGQRQPEIGMRMALGASRSDIVRMVLKKGLTVTIGGAAIGLIAAAALSRLLSSQLVGVGATDALSYLVTTTLVVAVALLASYLPARRAASVDPLTALRGN